MSWLTSPNTGVQGGRGENETQWQHWLWARKTGQVVRSTARSTSTTSPVIQRMMNTWRRRMELEADENALVDDEWTTSYYLIILARLRSSSFHLHLQFSLQWCVYRCVQEYIRHIPRPSDLRLLRLRAEDFRAVVFLATFCKDWWLIHYLRLFIILLHSTYSTSGVLLKLVCNYLCGAIKWIAYKTSIDDSII